MMPNLDKESCFNDKKVKTTLNKNGIQHAPLKSFLEKIILSSKVMKFNHLNKQQERILLITDQNIYNIIPPSFLGNFLANISSSFRIKRLPQVIYSFIEEYHCTRFMESP